MWEGREGWSARVRCVHPHPPQARDCLAKRTLFSEKEGRADTWRVCVSGESGVVPALERRSARNATCRARARRVRSQARLSGGLRTVSAPSCRPCFDRSPRRWNTLGSPAQGCCRRRSAVGPRSGVPNVAPWRASVSKTRAYARALTQPTTGLSRHRPPPECVKHCKRQSRGGRACARASSRRAGAPWRTNPARCAHGGRKKKNVTPRSTHLADDQHGQHSQRCGAGHWGAFAGTGEWGEGGQRGEERGGARFSHKKS